MKKYVVIFIFTKDYNEVLMVKRNKKPYMNLYNGIGGKIEEGETAIQAAIRECMEETSIKLENPKLLVTYHYSESVNINTNVELNVIYATHEKVNVEPNEEGEYSWENMDFVMDFNNKLLAGYANVSQMIREARINENLDKFYE